MVLRSVPHRSHSFLAEFMYTARRSRYESCKIANKMHVPAFSLSHSQAFWSSDRTEAVSNLQTARFLFFDTTHASHYNITTDGGSRLWLETWQTELH